MTTFLIVGGISVAVIMTLWVFVALCFRTVVPTNYVHILQSSKATVSYGKGKEAGNTYYKWPAFVPAIGVRTIELPVSVFNRSLSSYPGYDKDRVPFVVDIEAFFRITDSNIAAERVETIDQLTEQLDAILQGAARSILARNEINEILEGRGKFGEEFTAEVDEQLKQWGVGTVKTIELMDIRDAQGSQVIANIMAKKKSAIESESRIEVANNLRAAQMKEIEAKREVDLAAEQAEQQVGERQAQKAKAVGIANELAEQEIKEAARTTAEKEMAVRQVEEVRGAEIAKEVQIVKAAQQRETDVIRAEGQKQQTVLIAEGKLAEEQRAAEGIKARGEAEAEAKRLLELAPISAQIELAKEIGENQGYQEYLIKLRGIEAGEVVGQAQAGALEAANIKVIANAGNAPDGIKNAMQLFTPAGGTQLGGMLEGLANTEAGQELLKRFGINGHTEDA